MVQLGDAHSALLAVLSPALPHQLAEVAEAAVLPLEGGGGVGRVGDAGAGEADSEVAEQEGAAGEREEDLPEGGEPGVVAVEEQPDEEGAEGEGSEEERVCVRELLQCGPSRKRGYPFSSLPRATILPKRLTTGYWDISSKESEMGFSSFISSAIDSLINNTLSPSNAKI